MTVTWLTFFVPGGSAAEPPEAPASPSGQEHPPSGPDAQAAQAAEQERAMALMDEEAKQHFKLGKALYEAGRFPEAAREFEEAYRLSNRPQLLYNVYVAERDASNLPAAIAALTAYLQQVPEAPDRVNLRARLKSMEEAKARQDAQQAEAKRAAQEAEQARRERDRQPRYRTETVHSTIPYYLMGGGGALIVGSIVTGVLASGKAGDLDDVCTEDKKCPEGQGGAIDSLQTLTMTTDVLWISGAAVAGTGLVLWLTGALDRERQVPIAGLSCDGHGCRASWQGRF